MPLKAYVPQPNFEFPLFSFFLLYTPHTTITMDIGQLDNPFKSKTQSRDGTSEGGSDPYQIGDYDEPAPQPQQQQQQPSQDQSTASQVADKVKSEAQHAKDKLTGNEQQ